MSQLSLAGVGNEPIIFTLPALTYPTLKGPAPITQLPGVYYGFFPYVVQGSPAGMRCGFAGDRFGPFFGTVLPAVTGPALYARGGTPDALPLPAGIIGQPLPVAGWIGPPFPYPPTSPSSVSLTITDANGFTVYILDGAGGQALPGGLATGDFTITPSGLEPNTQAVAWYLTVP
jgi:hypothetical protein